MSPITMNQKDLHKISSNLEQMIKEHKTNKAKRTLASLIEVSSHRFPDMRIFYDRKGNKVLVETKTL